MVQDNTTHSTTDSGVDSTTDSGVDIKALLALASKSNTDSRVVDTIKLYQDKLNIAPDSGVVIGDKYSIIVGGTTLIIYNDNKGTTTASGKGKQGIMLSLNSTVKNNTIYKQGVKQGKSGKVCKDYDITHHLDTDSGRDYLLIDLQQYSDKVDTDSDSTTDSTDTDSDTDTDTDNE